MVLRIIAGLAAIDPAASAVTNESLTKVDEVQATASVDDVESEWVPFEATAYTADCRGCIGITKSGVDVRNTTLHDGKTVIAVDPDVIPLGSAVEIRLADVTIIEGTAQDVGAAIRGNRIDVLHAEYDAAIEFGRQDVEVRIVTDEPDYKRKGDD